ASRTEVETCRATRDWFQGVVEASARVCREQDLLLFLHDHPAFSLAPEQRFQLSGVEEVSGGGHYSKVGSAQPPLCHPRVLAQVCLMPPADDGASLEKEARRWATRVARDHKNRAHSEEVGVVLPHGAPGEAAAVERQMEEARENIRKAEVSRVKAEARLALLRAAGLNVDAWLAGATMVGTGEETPTGLDPAEFDDYEDSDEPDEDDEPGPAARTYPYTCRVIFGYQVWPCLPGPHPACPGMAPQPLCHFVPRPTPLRSLGCSCGFCLLRLGTRQGRSATSLKSTSSWLQNWSLYDYEGQSPEELSFPEGAIIRVLPRAAGEVDDGFWTGDFDGRVGVFPSLVVEELTGAREAAGQVGGRSGVVSPLHGQPLIFHDCQGGDPLPTIAIPLGCVFPGAAVAVPSALLPSCGPSVLAPLLSHSLSLSSPSLQLRAPPPPPGRAPEPDPELHLS
uniref:FCH and double SH3 domains 1 n=1 Tax=Cyanistes caeruleus TaxID=156563 RepID=A0A8C0UXM8_CYACU